jgi:hypothetical protein
MDDDECGAVGGMSGRGNRSTRTKTCPTATLSTTNPTPRHLGSNTGRRGGKPTTNGLTPPSVELEECPLCLPHLVPASVRMAWNTSAACREQATAQRTARGTATRTDGPRNLSGELVLHVEGW